MPSSCSWLFSPRKDRTSLTAALTASLPERWAEGPFLSQAIRKNWHLCFLLASASLTAPGRLFPWASRNQLPFPGRQDRHKIATQILLLTPRIHVYPLTQIILLFLVSCGEAMRPSPFFLQGIKIKQVCDWYPAVIILHPWATITGGIQIILLVTRACCLVAEQALVPKGKHSLSIDPCAVALPQAL